MKRTLATIAAILTLYSCAHTDPKQLELEQRFAVERQSLPKDLNDLIPKPIDDLEKTIIFQGREYFHSGNDVKDFDGDGNWDSTVTIYDSSWVGSLGRAADNAKRNTTIIASKKSASATGCLASA